MLKILYITNQPPGWGGAATESYEMIKRLWVRGVEVTGLFVDHCAKRCRGADNLPYDPVGNWHDPESVGGIRKGSWCARQNQEYYTGDFNIVVGKNVGGELCAFRPDLPRVFVSSGIHFFSANMHKPYMEVMEPVPSGGQDARNFQAVDHVFIHSTIDMTYYARWMSAELRSKIYGGVIYTPDVAIRDMREIPRLPFAERPFDFCFAASSWTRTMKNFGAVRELVRAIPAAKTAICGVDYDIDLANVTRFGLVPHRKMLEILGLARTVIIPSFYDPSPNLYAEGIAMGCNLVVSPNVGNIPGHPTILLSPSCGAGDLINTANSALLQKRQLVYRTVDPDVVVDQMLHRLTAIVQMHGSGHGTA